MAIAAAVAMIVTTTRHVLPAGLNSTVNVGRFSCRKKHQRKRRKKRRQNDDDDDEMMMVTESELMHRDPHLGEDVNFYGFAFTWSNLHESKADLERQRQVGDDAADEAVRELHEMGIRPRLHAVEEAAAAKPDGACARLVHECSIEPPWLDRSRLRRGQRFFLRHMVITAPALFHLSLVGGFGAPLICRVLSATGYLSGCGGGAYRRLLETAVMVIDCMAEDALVPGSGDGWKGVLAVRLLHAEVRVRLMAKASWKREKFGVPINQEDLRATQLAFSMLVLYAVERVGMRASWEDMEDYMHLWRYIGVLMGVKSDERPPAMRLDNIDSAKAQLESILLHLVRPDDAVAKMVNNVLFSIVDRPPRRLSANRVISLTRFYTSNAYADVLGVPHLPPFWSAWYHIAMYALTCHVVVTIMSLPALGPWLETVSQKGSKKIREKLASKENRGCPVDFGLSKLVEERLPYPHLQAL